ncbi:hypothetical protein BC831DRAFT_455311 [Entophlyctis helioformis]|nr:hypothetical protein BC831DRAFT_455311 [Entophlyctis helioformis]
MSLQTCQVSEAVLQDFKQGHGRLSKSKPISALILKIDVPTLTVVEDQFMTNTSLEEIAEELPESTPRFMIVTYQINHKDGRVSYPLVGLYYNPSGSSTSNRMLYASTASLLFQKANVVGKVFDFTESETLTDEWLVQKLESTMTRP